MNWQITKPYQKNRIFLTQVALFFLSSMLLRQERSYFWWGCVICLFETLFQHFYIIFFLILQFHRQEHTYSGVLSKWEIFIKMRAALLAPILPRVMKKGESKEGISHWWNALNLIGHYSMNSDAGVGIYNFRHLCKLQVHLLFTHKMLLTSFFQSHANGTFGIWRVGAIWWLSKDSFETDILS